MSGIGEIRNFADEDRPVPSPKGVQEFWFSVPQPSVFTTRHLQFFTLAGNRRHTIRVNVAGSSANGIARAQGSEAMLKTISSPRSA
jgi:hypothetical protein